MAGTLDARGAAGRNGSAPEPPRRSSASVPGIRGAVAVFRAQARGANPPPTDGLGSVLSVNSNPISMYAPCTLAPSH